MTLGEASPFLTQVYVGILFVIGTKSSEFITLYSCVPRVPLLEQPQS